MIEINKDNFNKEIEEIFRAFNLNNYNLEYDIKVLSNKVNITIIYGKIYNTSYKLLLNKPKIVLIRQIKRWFKRDLYRILSNYHGIKLPYGSLTGVRPTKLLYELLREGKDAENELINEFDVSSDKVSLICRVIDNQKGIYRTDMDNINLFINIPFCTTRCAYCSFASCLISKSKDLLNVYVDKLCEDIAKAKKIIDTKNSQLRSIYIGGGTPTSLPLEYLKRILKEINNNLSIEFTLEAGRPDSITEDNLKLMKDYGVTRVSVNPQTFNQKTLDVIGRNHSIDSITDAYNMARTYDFDINMDLIAMLPGEGYDDFCYSIDKAISLRPNNITIHTLSLKRGTKLKLEEFDNKDSVLAEKMIKYADSKLCNEYYNPYYMYRQKYMSGNLENTGYCISGKQCIYNIDIMEETHSIIACGAGGISKRVANDKIDRSANAKDIRTYINRFDSIMSKRKELFN